MIVRMMDTDVSLKPEKKACDEMIWELLQMTEHFQEKCVDSTTILNKIFETKQCDNYYPLEELRVTYTEHLGDEYKKAVAMKKEEEIEYRATYTLLHHHIYTRKKLVETLSYPSKLYYWWYKSQFFFATTGVLASGYFGAKNLHQIRKLFINGFKRGK